MLVKPSAFLNPSLKLHFWEHWIPLLTAIHFVSLVLSFFQLSLVFFSPESFLYFYPHPLSFMLQSVAEKKSNAPYQCRLCLVGPSSLLRCPLLSNSFLFVSVSVFGTSHRHFRSTPHCAFRSLPRCVFNWPTRVNTSYWASITSQTHTVAESDRESPISPLLLYHQFYSKCGQDNLKQEASQKWFLCKIALLLLSNSCNMVSLRQFKAREIKLLMTINHCDHFHKDISFFFYNIKQLLVAFACWEKGVEQKG